jgi:hypothetical protein
LIQTGGSGLHPKMGVPDTLYFPTTLPLDTSTVLLTIHNNSIADTIFTYTYSLDISTTFQFKNLADSKPDTIYAGDSLSIPFIYAPANTNGDKATFTIKSNAAFYLGVGKSVVFIGNQHPSAVAQRPVLAPDELSLEQNYPNPFGQFTGLSYFIPQGAHLNQISLKVFDVLGRQIADLTPLVTKAGNGHVMFNAAPLPEGTYFCRLSDGLSVQSIAMLHVK